MVARSVDKSLCVLRVSSVFSVFLLYATGMGVSHS